MTPEDAFNKLAGHAEDLALRLVATQKKLAAETARAERAEQRVGWYQALTSPDMANLIAVTAQRDAETARADKAEADMAEALGYLDNLHHYASKASHGCTNACGTQRFLKRFKAKTLAPCLACLGEGGQHLHSWCKP